MAHFAELDGNNKVLRVIVVSNEDTLNANGQEDESVGIAFCQNLLGGNWIKTSYSASIRNRFASVGHTYDTENNVFIEPQPYPSWTLDKNFAWQAPKPYPTDGNHYKWDETAKDWVIDIVVK